MIEALADVATATAIGRRDRQEDAVFAQFTEGADTGFAVLSDGMGGHDDGDLAARIIVSRIFGSICLSDRTDSADHSRSPGRLRQAVLFANQGLRDQIDVGMGKEGMGGTVITTILREDTLNWISIGDSGLYLFRRNRLSRLNEIHSLAPQIDLMLRHGEIDAETARHHPQRNCLTSALVGAGINRIDCPTQPIELRRGDIILMASDGLDVLEASQIRGILRRNRSASSQQISRALLQAVAESNAPDQDNVSIVVIKPQRASADCADFAVEFSNVRLLFALLQSRLSGLRQTVAAVLRGRSAL